LRSKKSSRSTLTPPLLFNSGEEETRPSLAPSRRNQMREKGKKRPAAKEEAHCLWRNEKVKGLEGANGGEKRTPCTS